MPAASTAPRRGAPAPAGVLPGGLGVTPVFSAVGRTLLVLAGAFVLRALTDGGALPTRGGVALGIAYAALWLALAHRAAPRAGELAAISHGVGFVAIAFPLVFEATSRFGIIGPTGAVVGVALASAAVVGVAAHRRLRLLAWLGVGAGLATSIAVMFQGGRVVPVAIFVAVFATATFWASHALRWPELHWPATLLAVLLAVVVVGRSVAAGAAEGPASAVLVIGLVALLGLGSVAVRTLALRRSPGPFELFQTPAVLALAIGGLSFLAARAGASTRGLGIAAIVLGATAYAVAIAVRAQGDPARSTARFYAGIALLLVLPGTALALPAGVVGATWALLGIAAGLVGRRPVPGAAPAQAAIFAVAGLAAAGLLGGAAGALLGPFAPPWPPPSVPTLVTLAAAAVTAWLVSGAERTSLPSRVLQLLLVTATALAAAGVAAAWLVPLVAGAPGPGADLGAAATARTAVLVGGVIGLAGLGRVRGWLETGWLAYPVLVATGLKVVAEDLRRGRPATLVVSFALCGAALLVVPRLRAPSRAGDQGPGPAA